MCKFNQFCTMLEYVFIINILLYFNLLSYFFNLNKLFFGFINKNIFKSVKLVKYPTYLTLFIFQKSSHSPMM